MTRYRLLLPCLSIAAALSACALQEAGDDGLGADEPAVGSQVSALSWPVAGADTLVTSLRTDPNILNFGCLDMVNGSPRWMNQHPCHGRDHQLFRFEWTGSAFRIRSKKDNGLCLDVPGSNYEDHQRVQFYPCHGGANQLWIVHQTDAVSSTIRPWARPTKCLDVWNGVAVTPEKIQLSACHGNSNQQWQFHSIVDSDGLSCDSRIAFGGTSPVVLAGASAAFRAAGVSLGVRCADDFFGLWDSVHCDPDDTDTLVVDRLGGPGGYTVRCFRTDPNPTPDPPDPEECPAPQVCCNGTAGDCVDCRPPNFDCENQ
jgi:hypothetical protein